MTKIKLIKCGFCPPNIKKIWSESCGEEVKELTIYRNNEKTICFRCLMICGQVQNFYVRNGENEAILDK